MKTLSRLLVLISIFLFSCKSYQEVQVTGFKGFKVNKIDMKGIDADILLDIKNPNPVGFSIYRSSFDVTYSGIYLGTAKSKKRVHIAAGNEKTYSFNLQSDFKNVNLMDLMKLVKGGGNGMVEVNGDLKAGKFFIHKKFPVKLKERARLN
jgi:LEA14-like dessication related protein